MPRPYSGSCPKQSASRNLPCWIATLTTEMKQPKKRRIRLRSVACSVAVLAMAAGLRAQAIQPADPTPPAIPADQLVREAVAREVAANDDPSFKFMFHARRQTPKGSQTHLYVETDDAMAGMLVAVNDQPLTAQQRKSEDDHLSWLINNPDQLRKKRVREKDETERSLRIVKALPDAFRYEYAGSETGTPGFGKTGDPLLKLNFTPNPNYQPPSHVEQVLQGMEGYLLIDASAKRIARIDGTLFRDVSFGWGIIGHLDKGGHFRVQQAEVGDGHWDLSAMSLKMTGKILVFKSLNMVSDEVFTDFQRVPKDLTFAKAVEMLKAEEEKTAHQGETSSERKR